MTGMSFPPTATTTEGYESEREPVTCNNSVIACRTAAMPRTGSGHVA